jgi:hypothetical protein
VWCVSGVRGFGIVVRGGGLGDVNVKELIIPFVIRSGVVLEKVQFRGCGEVMARRNVTWKSM